MFGDSLDGGLEIAALAYIAALLVGLVLLGLVLRSLQYLIKNFRNPSKRLVERAALASFATAALVLIIFLAGLADIEWAAIWLAVAGVVLSSLAYPPFRLTAADKARRAEWSWPRRHKILTAVGVLVLTLAIVLSYQGQKEQSQKQDFAAASTAIDEIYKGIVAQLGPPNGHKRQNSCSASHEEFANMTYSCSIEIRFIYGIKNEHQANQNLNQIQNILRSHDFNPTQPAFTALSDRNVSGPEEHLATDYYRYKNMNCSVIYVYNTPHRIDLDVRNKLDRPLEISISCGEAVATPYYPVAD